MVARCRSSSVFGVLVAWDLGDLVYVMAVFDEIDIWGWNHPRFSPLLRRTHEIGPKKSSAAHFTYRRRFRVILLPEHTKKYRFAEPGLRPTFPGNTIGGLGLSDLGYENGVQSRAVYANAVRNQNRGQK